MPSDDASASPTVSDSAGPAPRAATKQLSRSATKLVESADRQTDSADRRTVLAADRTVLAGERTYAAWVRTGLAAMAAGIGSRALLDKLVPAWMIGATGSVLVLFSGFCFVAAIWREIAPGAPPPPPDTRRLPAWLLILVNGFLMLVSLAALIGLWA
jgi:putative membrane protein